MAAPNVGPSSSDEKSKLEAATKTFHHKMSKHPLAYLHAKLDPKSQSHSDAAQVAELLPCYIYVIDSFAEQFGLAELWNPAKNDLERLLIEMQNCWGWNEVLVTENERWVMSIDQ